MNDISRTKYFSLISGIIFLIVGIYIITRPLFIAYTINIIFCVMLLIEGISQISAYLSEKREGRSNWRLVEGIISIIIGIYLVIGYPLGLPITIIVAIGIWLFFIGIISVIQIIFGIIVILNPLLIASYISLIIAISLIVQAIVAIFRFFRLNRMERKLK